MPTVALAKHVAAPGEKRPGSTRVTRQRAMDVEYAALVAIALEERCALFIELLIRHRRDPRRRQSHNRFPSKIAHCRKRLRHVVSLQRRSDTEITRSCAVVGASACPNFATGLTLLQTFSILTCKGGEGFISAASLQSKNQRQESLRCQQSHSRST